MPARLSLWKLIPESPVLHERESEAICASLGQDLSILYRALSKQTMAGAVYRPVCSEQCLAHLKRIFLSEYCVEATRVTAQCAPRLRALFFM